MEASLATILTISVIISFIVGSDNVIFGFLNIYISLIAYTAAALAASAAAPAPAPAAAASAALVSASNIIS